MGDGWVDAANKLDHTGLRTFSPLLRAGFHALRPKLISGAGVSRKEKLLVCGIKMVQRSAGEGIF